MLRVACWFAASVKRRERNKVLSHKRTDLCVCVCTYIFVRTWGSGCVFWAKCCQDRYFLTAQATRSESDESLFKIHSSLSLYPKDEDPSKGEGKYLSLSAFHITDHFATHSLEALSAHYTPAGDIHQTHAPIELFRSAAARVRRKQKLFAAGSRAGKSTFSICGDERLCLAFGRSQQMEFDWFLSRQNAGN